MAEPSRTSGSRAEIESICRQHRLPLTTQRRAVLETLPQLNHPTVDEIWEEVRKALPEISRTTVYRILETFARLRVIRKVCHPGAVARYEDRTIRHHHLLCLRCGTMTDLDDPVLDVIKMPGEETGFRIEDYSIQFRGLCRKCARRPASKTSNRKVNQKRKRADGARRKATVRS